MTNSYKLLSIGGLQNGSIIDFSTEIFSNVYADVISWVVVRNEEVCGMINVKVDYPGAENNLQSEDKQNLETENNSTFITE